MPTRCYRLTAIAVLVSALWGAEIPLHLKTRAITTERTYGDSQTTFPKRRAYGRNHILLQFREAPQVESIRELERRGALVLDYVPDYGLVISADDYFTLDGLDLARTERLSAQDKISPLLSASSGTMAELFETTEQFVVEFFRDVDSEDARDLARQSGLVVREHPGLNANHLLVEGTRTAAAQLAEWDEVAYIFPASRELQAGEPVYSCAGAATQYGVVGQYTGRMGDGWDGAGLGSAQLGYYFGTLASGVPRADVQAEILRALRQWSKSAAITFTPAAGASTTRTISILFGKRSHGDAYPFDGPGQVLAHTFYPAPPNPESIAGDMHFDDDENWNIGANVDVFSVALHEAGHALGLAHSDNPGSVMYPYYKRVTALTDDDIAAILQLYAKATSETPSQPGSPTDPTDPTDPETPTDPTTPATPVAPVVAITSPTSASTFATSVSPVMLGGSASHSSGISHVWWASSRGGSGPASGTTAWAAGPLALQPGQNLVTVTATAGTGTTASRTLTITYRTPAPSGDTVPPTLTILSPLSVSVGTTASTATISGTARDNVAVVQVTWTDSVGNSGIATGATYWKAASIPLRVGANTITIRAYDVAGNVSWRSVVFTRK